MYGKATVNTMSHLKIVLVVLVPCMVSVLLPSCASKSAPTPEGQVVTVQRGNLSTDITGVGNLALSKKVDLAFEMDGTVAEVLVEEAASVKEGQLLARLDTSAWEEHIIELEDAVTAAERNVTAKERAVTAAQRNVTTAEQNVSVAQRNVTQAERSVTSKKYDLLQAQINLNNAQLSLEQTEEASTDPLEIEIKELQVELAKGKLDDAQFALDQAATEGIQDAKQAVTDAQVRLEDAKIAVEDAQIAVNDAKKALDNANKALDEARKASPEVKAPFAGFITKVNVKGGDEVKKGTVAATIADPTKFEADVMVSEANILNVKLDGDATVLVEAAQGMNLPAKVTHISPSATIQQGVVNYTVKVEIQSLTPVATSPSSGRISTGSSSASSRQATGQGNSAQQQAGGTIRQRQQTTIAQPRQTSSVTPSENVQLREGLTVTVSILTAERRNVLMVPAQAIISRGGETIVQVLKDGVSEERSVQIGISNWQYVEITGGLSEGEQVIVPVVTNTTTPGTSQQRQSQSSGGIVPGIQRILR